MRRSVRNALKFGVPLVAFGLVGLMLIPAETIHIGSATFVPPAPAAKPAPKIPAARIASLQTPTPRAAKLAAQLQTQSAPAAAASAGVKPAVELFSTGDYAAPDLTTLPATGSADVQPSATPTAPAPSDATANLPIEQVGSVAVNMRAGPSVSNDKLSVLQPGESVKVGETTGGWVHVYRADGTDGWVYGRYLDGGGAPATPTAPSQPVVARASPAPQRAAAPSRLPPPQVAGVARLTSVVPLLQRPDDFRSTLGILQPGERVRILNSDGRWLHIVTEDGATGWIPA
jgi:SH3-like domain-containing protein